jgi:hypothetical protein
MEIPKESTTTEEATTTPKVTEDPLACSCVLWAHHLNPKVPLVSAKWFKGFVGGTPTVGGVVIFKYPNGEHVAIITKFLPDGFRISESNFKRCEIGQRDIKFDDKRITGFFNP